MVTFGQALKEEGKAGEGFTGRGNRIGRGLEEKENTESRGGQCGSLSAVYGGRKPKGKRSVGSE